MNDIQQARKQLLAGIAIIALLVCGYAWMKRPATKNRLQTTVDVIVPRPAQHQRNMQAVESAREVTALINSRHARVDPESN